MAFWALDTRQGTGNGQGGYAVLLMLTAAVLGGGSFDGPATIWIGAVYFTSWRESSGIGSWRFRES